jgi:hypothetical protein
MVAATFGEAVSPFDGVLLTHLKFSNHILSRRDASTLWRHASLRLRVLARLFDISRSRSTYLIACKFFFTALISPVLIFPL